MSSYCDTAPGHPFHGPYHESEYGFPAYGENTLFERLVMEINQAGLSWLTVLKKRAAFFHAFGGFDPAVVAGYGEVDRTRLLGDASIIRNRRKIAAAIENARRICAIGSEFGSFAGWLDAQHPLAKAEWVALFRNTFVFTGGGQAQVLDTSRGGEDGLGGEVYLRFVQELGGAEHLRAHRAEDEARCQQCHQP